jgi:hypothetical protein
MRNGFVRTDRAVVLDDQNPALDIHGETILQGRKSMCLSDGPVMIRASPRGQRVVSGRDTAGATIGGGPIIPMSVTSDTFFFNDERSAATRAHERIKELLASGVSLRETLDELVRIVENVTPSGMIGSVLILSDDGRHLLHGAGPSLPAEYNQAIHGIEIGPEVGSCGTAAYHGKTVSVYDIATNPLWANFKDLALQHGLRACWSTPIHGSDGKILGTFANYYRFVRDPSPVDQELTQLITHIAAMAIEHDRERRAASPAAQTTT